MFVLTINSGSSSIKFSVYDGDREITSGKMSGKPDQTIPAILAKIPREQIEAIGFRIVHGGPKHFEPEKITPALRDELKGVTDLAPDHMPDQLAVIHSVEQAMPGLPTVACFDTAFHRRMPRVAQLYGLTRQLADQGVIRYGFHGLSYSYIVDQLRKESALPERLVVAHLGNGSSMAAIRNGASVDTTMGLTPTGGFLMSNRSGDMDPGVVLHLIRQRGMSAEDVDRLVTKDGGLKGMSGMSSDMQELVRFSSENPAAAEAVDLYCYQARKFLGAMTMALGGIDLLVFTGGIGENSAVVRDKIVEGISALGNPPVRAIKTNEEIMIARGTAAALTASGSNQGDSR